MNYLAHIFLSGNDAKLQVGNFIGDAVKGSSYKEYPQPISDGILLHRAIDYFTDGHPEVKRLTHEMKPQLGRYSGVLVDIFFDHLLASRFSEFSDVSLRLFTRRFYWALFSNRRILPKRFRSFMWHFISTDRLSKYTRKNGIAESLGIMMKYHKIDISVEQAIEYLTIHEEELWEVFVPFFEELRKYSLDFLSSADREKYFHSLY